MYKEKSGLNISFKRMGLINMNNYNSEKIRDMTTIGLMVALLSVTSYIVFPLPFTPILITAQTIIINLIALTLKPKKAVMTILIFLLIGSIGIPVFSGGKAGIGTLVGPSGGYFVGFIIAVFCISYLRGNTIALKKYLLLTIAVGIPIISFCGAAWMSYYNGITIIETIKVSVLPFVVGDIFKAVLASVIAVKLNKILWSKKTTV